MTAELVRGSLLVLLKSEDFELRDQRLSLLTKPLDLRINQLQSVKDGRTGAARRRLQGFRKPWVVGSNPIGGSEGAVSGR